VADEPNLDTAAAEIVAADLESDQDDILQRRRSRRTRSVGGGGPRWWLVAALLVGVATGAWLAGRYFGGPEAAPAAMPSDHPTATAQAGGSGHDMPGMGLSEEESKARKAELDQRLAEDPGNLEALYELAEINVGLDSPDQARDNWLAITELDPEQSLAWYNLGFYYLSVDPPDKEAAKAALGKVIEIGPADSMLATRAQSHLDAIDNPNTDLTEG